MRISSVRSPGEPLALPPPRHAADAIGRELVEEDGLFLLQAVRVVVVVVVVVVEVVVP